MYSRSVFTVIKMTTIKKVPTEIEDNRAVLGTRILATQQWISWDPHEQWGGDTKTKPPKENQKHITSMGH